jgi:hypothetical protein
MTDDTLDALTYFLNSSTDSTTNVSDFSLTVENDLDVVDTDGDRLAVDDREYEFSAEFEIGTDVVVCPHCAEANDVPDPRWLFFLETDPDCLRCGFPLGVVR